MPNRHNLKLFEEFPWHESELGPIAQWPAEMLAVVRTALNSGFPVSTGWGPGSVQIYNDAYNSIYGDKHPMAFGRPVSQSWPEIWEFLQPALEQVRSTRAPLWFKGLLLPLAKHGQPEECYFDFSYSAVTDAGGDVLGMISIAVEKTFEVVSERRLRMNGLTPDAGDQPTSDGTWEQLRELLADNEMDAAAAALFLVDPRSRQPGDVRWSLRAAPHTVAAMRSRAAAAMSATRSTTIDLAGLDLPEGCSGEARVIPISSRADEPLALLVLVPHRLVPGRSHATYADGLSARLHAVLHFGHAHEKRLDDVQQALEERDTLYRFLFDNIGDAAFYSATEGGPASDEFVLAANRQACTMFGYSAQEFVGLSREALFFPDDPGLRAALAERGNHGSFLGELVFRAKDGRAVPVEVSSKLVTLRSGETRSVSLVRDISQRIARDQERSERARFESVAQLTGGIAHDFNNLLTVILGSVEALEARLGDGTPERALAATALMGAERAAALTSQLLSYSRRQALQTRSTDLNAFVHEVRALLQSSLGEINTLTLETGAPIPPCEVDTTQLTTALLNLVVNARDAMPAGGSITLSTGSVQLEGDATLHAGYALAAGSYIRLRVEDTGPGIPSTVQARMFEPFFTTKEVGGGSGLGLSMVQGFVRQSGGDARVDSRPGSGTRFDLLFPASTAAAVTEPDEIPALSVQGQRVLLVEDNPLVRQQVNQMLVDAGFRSAQANDAREALALLAQGLVVDIVLTDLVMPGGMSGLALTSELARRHPGLPVLIMTGYASQDVLGHDGDQQFQVLVKPFTSRTLVAALLRRLNDQRVGP